ncbi:MAG: YqeG family HAD IIIA-type phosphatase [Thermanaeromonas sp.]|uniref:YqeG family HAD IIIA-type phosphatase n=1 Tax=Thermanaeromonas sp. TaxID=2003697 RepID=UPI00243979A9|nr:YqeG family HAD IIIA-type phosphatase [Thermanaeromonas sp.]MCG0278415.1 YqeG family HAD IIIA-type phosphatase [Thermanaeromonas sp.]
MLRYLRPDLYVKSLQDVPLEHLSRRGIRGLIIDLDNTVTQWGCATLDTRVQEWFSNLRSYGMGACLLSNNRQKRVEAVARELGIPALFRAGKPRGRAFRQAMALLGTSPAETAVIGDQIFTDVLGGNLLDLYTILVVPLDKKEFLLTRLIRLVERIVLKCLNLQEPR